MLFYPSHILMFLENSVTDEDLFYSLSKDLYCVFINF